ncbi:MAG TPA: YdcF family protein [Verrucomicrobiae bacterium]|nr:YdcF family protein [Verrucomicrobiae bacterium]
MSFCVRRSLRPGDSQRGGIFFRLISLICFLCLLFALYLVRQPLLRWAGGFWVVDETPIPADAIVMLGDDNFSADRAGRAAQLYKSGYAPTVVASGRFLRAYASIAELEEHDLRDRGVPQAAIMRFTHHAENTREETAALARLITSRNWKRVLLVTSNYHTRRSRYLAERQFPAGTVLRVVSAPDSDYDPRDWWRSRGGLKIFAHECVGILVSMWEMRDRDVQTTESGFLPALP